VARTKLQVSLSLAMLAIGAGLLGAGAAHGEGARATVKVREGGTFRVSGLGAVDPALGSPDSPFDLTCAHLMRYPDLPAPRGLRLVPEVAKRYPRVSNAGKTYTFTLWRGFRFSNKGACSAIGVRVGDCARPRAGG